MISTPVMAVQGENGSVVAVSSLDSRVRPKRFYLQPGAEGYRVEAIYEHDAWRNDHQVPVPRWRLVRAPTLDDALAPHFTFLQHAFQLVPWEERADLPAWARDLALVVTLHGMHYTGYMFNDYAGMAEILRWMATRIAPSRVLVFLPAWDGRYYYDYPTYHTAERMGGEVGFRQLVTEARGLATTWRRCSPQRGQPAAPELARHPGRRDGEDRRRRVQSQLGGLEQRPAPGWMARLHERGRGQLARVPPCPDR
jgi:hypothetical protein